MEIESLAPFKINVHDDGPGISPKDRERIFDPFYRVLGTGVSGTGLGMAIVKTLAERNGLSVALSEAQNGKGLKVTFSQKI